MTVQENSCDMKQWMLSEWESTNNRQLIPYPQLYLPTQRPLSVMFQLMSSESWSMCECFHWIHCKLALFYCVPGGPLHLGDIEDMAGMESPRVVCPWHKWCFELATGRLIRPAWKHQDIQSYPVITNSSGQIFIGFSSIDPTCFIQDPDF